MEATTSAASADGQPSTSTHKALLTFWSAFAIIISMQIGSGIFASPAYVITLTQSPVLALCVWLLAGLLAWQGASSLVEFAVALPRNGGPADYLDFCYGRYWSYLFSFAWIVIGRPCSNAAISLILSDHLLRAFSPNGSSSLAKSALAMLALNGMTFLNTMGVKFGARSAVVFMTIKLSIAATIVACGLFFAVTHPSSSLPPLSSSVAPGPKVKSLARSDVADPVKISESLGRQTSHFVTAVFAAVHAYGGWENIGFIAGEMDRPSLNVPRVIHTAMPLVLVCLLTINIALYAVLDPIELVETDAVAAVFGQKLFGFPGGVMFAVMVAVSCLGALNSIIFTVARLTQEAGARGFLPSKIVVHSVRKWLRCQPAQEAAASGMLPQGSAQITLTQAMWTNAALANLYLLVGTFRTLILFKGVVDYFFYCIIISGVFRLRSRFAETATSQTYRAPTVSPLVFCAVSAFIVIWQILAASWIVLAFSLMLSVASSLYYVTDAHIVHDYAPVRMEET